MVTPISQRDIRWKDVKIGKSKLTIADFGCTISSCCMALEKLRGYTARPDDAAKFWKFTTWGGIIWTGSKFKGMKFIWRGYDADLEKVKEYANSEGKAAVMNVDAFGKKGGHWVYVESVDGDLIRIVDPWDGKRYPTLPSKYRFCGYALFEAKPIT